MSKSLLLVLLILVAASVLLTVRRPATAEETVDEDIQARLRTDIYAGDQTWYEIREACQDMAKDLLYQDLISEEQVVPKAASLEKFAKRVWDQKLQEEKSWPDVTDFERLDSVFERLLSLRIVALHKAGFTMSDGLYDVSEYAENNPEGQYLGYCFYHGQDTARAVEGEPLFLAFGDLSSDDDARRRKFADIIVRELKAEGFKPRWDGDVQKRIELPLKYQRRSPLD